MTARVEFDRKIRTSDGNGSKKSRHGRYLQIQITFGRKRNRIFVCRFCLSVQYLSTPHTRSAARLVSPRTSRVDCSCFDVVGKWGKLEKVFRGGRWGPGTHVRRGIGSVDYSRRRSSGLGGNRPLGFLFCSLLPSASPPTTATPSPRTEASPGLRAGRRGGCGPGSAGHGGGST